MNAERVRSAKLRSGHFNVCKWEMEEIPQRRGVPSEAGNESRQQFSGGQVEKKNVSKKRESPIA